MCADMASQISILHVSSALNEKIQPTALQTDSANSQIKMQQIIKYSTLSKLKRLRSCQLLNMMNLRNYPNLKNVYDLRNVKHLLNLQNWILRNLRNVADSHQMQDVHHTASHLHVCSLSQHSRLNPAGHASSHACRRP